MIRVIKKMSNLKRVCLKFHYSLILNKHQSQKYLYIKTGTKNKLN